MIIIDMVSGEIETSPPAQTRDQEQQPEAAGHAPVLAPALHEATEAISERPKLHIPDIDAFIDSQD